jgi:hypothetical protein
VGGAAGELVGTFTGVVGVLPEGVVGFVVAGGLVVLGADAEAVELCPLPLDPPQALNRHVSASAVTAARKAVRNIDRASLMKQRRTIDEPAGIGASAVGDRNDLSSQM